MSEFWLPHVNEQAGKRIRLSVKPRRIRVGRRSRVRVRAVPEEARSQSVAGAVVSVGRRAKNTGRRGYAVFRLKPRRAKRVPLAVSKPPLEPTRTTVRVKR